MNLTTSVVSWRVYLSEITVTIADLRRACDVVLTHLQELGYENVRFPYDHYWEVLVPDAFDMDSKPQELAVGSLEDDIERMGRIITNGTDASVTDLEPLAAILRVIGSVTLESGRKTVPPTN